MRLPFPKWILVTPIKVYVEEVTEDGVSEVLIYDGQCNLSEKSRTTMNEQRQLVELSGKAIFQGDINPGKPIKGYVELEGTKRTIYKTRKPRNPDGSIYSTELELM